MKIIFTLEVPHSPADLVHPKVEALLEELLYRSEATQGTTDTLISKTVPGATVTIATQP